MRTTVNLRILDVENLLKICALLKRKRSMILCMCLRKYFASHRPRLMSSLLNRLVQYQPDGIGYCICPIVFDVDVYNLAVNFRVFSRLSVSKMLTEAMNDYLDEIVEEFEGTRQRKHNYNFYQHLLRHNSSEMLPEWQIIWKVGEKLRE